MAPHWPEEVDVFSVPHTRMKTLVHRYSNMITATDFRDECHLTALLENLRNVFTEFKAHEHIENKFIMKQLRHKLRAASITNAAVCNCHNDNRLTDMLDLVTDGYRWTQKTERERQLYGRRLKHALEDFTRSFIPHMEEEEEVFQPMLLEYFSYEELKDLKAKVIHQHDISNKKEEYHHEKFVEDFYESDNLCEEDAELECHFTKLPSEICLQIFSYLSPRDLAIAGQVSLKWHQMTRDPILWPKLYPVHWALGEWSFTPNTIGGVNGPGTPSRNLASEEEEQGAYMCQDEDADVDESGDSDVAECGDSESLKQILHEAKVITSIVKYLLPKIGAGVKVCDLAYSRGISSCLVHKILKLCPNLEVLDLTHTRIGDSAFKEYGANGRQSKLKHLDLTGCENISDQTLISLALSGGKEGLTFGDRDEFDYDSEKDEVEIENVPPPCAQKVPVCCQQVICCRSSACQNMNSKNLAIVKDEKESEISCGQYENLSDSGGGSGDGCGKREEDRMVVAKPGKEKQISEGDPQTCDLSYVYLGILIESDGNLSRDTEPSLESERVNVPFSPPPTHNSEPSTISASSSPEKPEHSHAKRTCGMGVKPGQATERNGCCVKTNAKSETSRSCVSGSSSDSKKSHSSVVSEENPFPDDAVPQCGLEFLSLNGCYRITDVGLCILAEGGGTPNLHYLDLSGCVLITGTGISQLVSTAPRLDHSNLFYCDNISDDPYPTTASGCQNLQCGVRFCCTFRE